MAPLLQENKLIISEEEKKEALQELCKELEKGIWSLKNERTYTVEEAWEEIDKI